jgi:hypothetical protein
MFNNLEEKFKNHSQFRSSSIHNNFIGVAICFLVVLGIVIMDNYYFTKINAFTGQQSREAVRLVTKMASLTLVYSRLLNIPDNVTNPQYQVSRALIELSRVNEAIIEMDPAFYEPGSGPFHTSLGISLNWENSKGVTEDILFS